METQKMIETIKSKLPKHLNMAGASDYETQRLFILSQEKSELIEQARDVSETIQEILANIRDR